MQINVSSEKQLSAKVPEIIDYFGTNNIVLLHGDLGAGKTTLVKMIAHFLGCKDEVSSPTYSIINEYKTNSSPIYHIDLYRLNSVDEVLDIGIEDYLDSKNYCFIEWPEKVLDLLPSNYIEIEIEKLGENQRKFSIFKRSK